jgi:hypothetical protein
MLVPKKFCPKCKEEGAKSSVYPKGESRTLMSTSGYWDPEGDYHFHDPNTITSSYSCSGGHSWTESRKPECDVCRHKS